MATYDRETALALVKSRLNILSANTAMDDYLFARIEAAAQDLAGNGIALTDSQDDLLLLVDLAVWQYQNRDSSAGMPEWLRLRRRERWLRQRDP